MVIEALRALEAPITISQLGKIIGMDPDTIKLRISTGKFPTKPLILVGPDVRVDPQELANELERKQETQERLHRGGIDNWHRVGNEIHGFRSGEVKCMIPVTSDVFDLYIVLSDLACSHDWVEKRDLIEIARAWAEPVRHPEHVGPRPKGLTFDDFVAMLNPQPVGPEHIHPITFEDGVALMANALSKEL